VTEQGPSVILAPASHGESLAARAFFACGSLQCRSPWATGSTLRASPPDPESFLIESATGLRVVLIRASLIRRRAGRIASDETGKDRASDPVLPEAALTPLPPTCRLIVRNEEIRNSMAMTIIEQPSIVAGKPPHQACYSAWLSWSRQKMDVVAHQQIGCATMTRLCFAKVRQIPRRSL
jgi:hypothetical protein